MIHFAISDAGSLLRRREKCWYIYPQTPFARTCLQLMNESHETHFLRDEMDIVIMLAIMIETHSLGSSALDLTIPSSPFFR